MFRKDYQGGAVVEIFTAQGQDPVANWKLSGGPSAVRKEYNKEVKGFVFCLEGSTQTVKMQMPGNGKTPLGLLQRFLVLQLNIPQCKDFSVELVITDSEHLKRRLHLSTVHTKLTTTLLHARIPIVGLARDTWSTLCIDLVSFTTELFKGLLTLDGITLFATCKVRRIFTMKTGPVGTLDDDMFLRGSGLMDQVPRHCRFPPTVNHVTVVVNMRSLQKTDVETVPEYFHDPDQRGTTRSISHQQTRPEVVLHTASGSRPSAPPTHSGRKSSTASGRMNRSELSKMGSSFSRANTQNQSDVDLSVNSSLGEPSHERISGTPSRLQPAPQKDKHGGKEVLALQAIGEQIPTTSHSVAAPDHHSSKVETMEKSKTRENSSSPSMWQESRWALLTQTDKTQDLTAEESNFSPAEESFRAAPMPSECVSSWTLPGLSPDLGDRSSRERNEGPVPQLTLQEEVFIFSSLPHSPKRGQGQGDWERAEAGDEHELSKSSVRHEAQPEDDFVGSESDEFKSYSPMYQQRPNESSPVSSKTPDPAPSEQLDSHSKSFDIEQESPKENHPATSNIRPHFPSNGRDEPAAVAPTLSLSPSVSSSLLEYKCGPQSAEGINQVENGDRKVTLSRSLLLEVKINSSLQNREENKTSQYNPHVFGSLKMEGDDDDDDDDDEELRMLASLKREQEKDDSAASGLSASQIHQCNVNASVSSDDASTWTHYTLPLDQGQHYQNEMNPLRHSHPREWMDVVSPPIVTTSRPRRSGDTWRSWEHLDGGGEECDKEEEVEEEFLNLLYDPCLNCYFDPKTGKYYELS